jgi:hypothetical protein
MKLCEIYNDPADTWIGDDEDTTYLNKDAEHTVKSMRSKPNHKYLGSGSFAYVGTDDIDNFGDVHRVARTLDSGSQYLNVLYSHKTENPFLPKIRKVVQNGEAQVTIIERLVPFRTPAILNSIPLMKALWSKYFRIPWDPDQRHVMAAIPMILQVVCEDTDTSITDGVIKDPQLLEAVHIIRQIGHQVNGAIDMQSSNMMWRMTNYQPQLVFTDPLA